jgi:hypothetical protein
MVEAIRGGLPPGVELDEREEAILDLAARQARDVAAAEADITNRGYLVEGSRGQSVVNPKCRRGASGAAGAREAPGPTRIYPSPRVMP